MTEKEIQDLLLSLRRIHRELVVGTEGGFIPVGDIAHQAADMIESLANAKAEKEKEAAHLDSLLREAFPIRP
jgi:hypothetical protein